MFRLITEFQNHPSFFLMCGNGNCSEHATAHINKAGEQDLNATRNEFFQRLAAAGWAIDIGLILCPKHVAKAIQTDREAKKNAPMLVVPELSLKVG
jgi:hypothetical protein